MNRSVLLLLVMVIILISGCMQSETEDELSRARKAFINKEYTEAERFYQRYLRDNDNGTERWKVWNRLVEITGNVREIKIELSSCSMQCCWNIQVTPHAIDKFS